VVDEKKLPGRRIKEIRAGCGLSQEALAERMGVTAKYLSSIERGKENPTLDLFVKLARALKVDLGDLFNFRWLTMSERELRAKLREMTDSSDLAKLRELFALMRSRDL